MYMPFMEYTWPAAPEKFAAIARAMGVDTRNMSIEQAAASSVDAVKSLLTYINMTPTLTELGVKEEHFDWMVNNVLTTMKVVLSNNPKVPDAETIRDIYQHSL